MQDSEDCYGCSRRGDVLRPDEAVSTSRFLHLGVGRVPKYGEKLCSNLASGCDIIDAVGWLARDVVADLSMIWLRSG